MCVGFPTAGTWSSFQWRPDNEFETDMLYPQIPPDFLAAAEAEVKVNLGVISTGLI
jgi:Family of unknown function (DUF7019)